MKGLDLMYSWSPLSSDDVGEERVEIGGKLIQVLFLLFFFNHTRAFVHAGQIFYPEPYPRPLVDLFIYVFILQYWGLNTEPPTCHTFPPSLFAFSFSYRV
jgi:hypothetical protein